MAGNTVLIGNTLVGKDQPCYVVAEIGINHNGSLETAKEIINNPPNFLEKIELKEHLGPSRANGLNSLIKHINSVAKNSII